MLLCFREGWDVPVPSSPFLVAAGEAGLVLSSLQGSLGLAGWLQGCWGSQVLL